jgi:hypothetical protein
MCFAVQYTFRDVSSSRECDRVVQERGREIMKMRGAVCVVIAAATALVSSSAIAGVGKIHPLEGLDPVADGFNTNTVTNWFRGWEFTVNADNVTVTELGLRTPGTGEAVTLELWDVATQTRIASAAAVTAGNSWQYVSITPTALTNGSSYIVGIHRVGTGMYYWDNGLPAPWYPTGVIDYTQMRFHNSGTSQFPTSTLPDYQYGVADIGYVIPGPASIALLGIGLAGFARRRRTA